MFLENQDWSNSDCLATLSTYDSPLDTKGFAGMAKPVQASLTALEQGVVALSLFDHPSSIQPPRALARLLGWLCGASPPNQLADGRLEALRRYCILLRETNGAPAIEETGKALAAGFSEKALREADELVQLGRRR
ncbi:hypothetical protein [Edaphosphingomonas haloaromaticamans]|uniref:Uncharacterized protein n=1 Tax=Edaphosphingomonas haloaromaticamans TaxID=653954 RepID=A0A1S1HBD9_9SPHN|nr:hypothetical protein [Sphingomonas haloaromaticamans]OHT19132.1 hypothetical protein BHE75_01115 [Sphingomonas haloaromaticamans]